MGIFNKVNGRGKDKATVNQGEHSIDANSAMKQTDASVPTPLAPGQAFESIRSFPVCIKPRYFNTEEAAAVERLAIEKAANAKHSQRAFQALAHTELADTKVHAAHKQYLGQVATAETIKIAANGRLAEKLHKLRPDYAQIATGIETAQRQADYAIAARTGRIIAAKK